MSNSWSNIRSQVNKTSRKSPIFRLQKESKPIYGVFLGEPHSIKYEHNGRETVKVFINLYMTEPNEELRVLACCPEMWKSIDEAVDKNGMVGNLFSIQKVLAETDRDRPWINFECALDENFEEGSELDLSVNEASKDLFDLTKIADLWRTQNGK